MTKQVKYLILEADSPRMLEMLVQNVIDIHKDYNGFQMKVDTFVSAIQTHEYQIPITVLKYTASLHLNYND